MSRSKVSSTSTCLLGIKLGINDLVELTLPLRTKWPSCQRFGAQFSSSHRRKSSWIRTTDWLKTYRAKVDLNTLRYALIYLICLSLTLVVYLKMKWSSHLLYYLSVFSSYPSSLYLPHELIQRLSEICSPIHIHGGYWILFHFVNIHTRYKYLGKSSYNVDKENLKRECEGDLLNEAENVLFFSRFHNFMIFVLIDDTLMRYFKAWVISLWFLWGNIFVIALRRCSIFNTGRQYFEDASNLLNFFNKKEYVWKY